jgi:hypothetical protein
MAKSYALTFGSGDPRTWTGLAPTFLIFYSPTLGTTLPPPGISEVLAGSGFYNFSYGPTTSIQFLVDGAGSLSSSDRYIKGILDPIQAVDQSVGQVTDSFGSTNVDPATLLGYAKRNLEFNEGNKVYTKATGIWDVSSRGSSILLREKSLTNTTTSSSSS